MVKSTNIIQNIVVDEEEAWPASHAMADGWSGYKVGGKDETQL